jgi:hypothetical protein
MMHTRDFAIVSSRALAMLACAWLAMIGIQSTSAAEVGQADDIIPQTAQLEDWQLLVESNEHAASESFPDLAEPDAEELPTGPLLMDEYAGDPWAWRWLPEGLIYHSYMAGVYEPRLALVTFYEASDGRTLWDATLGGRVGLLQYGNGDPFSP